MDERRRYLRLTTRRPALAIALALASLVVSLAGCKGGLFTKASDTFPGVAAPAQRMEMLTKKTEEARAGGPAAQEAWAARLAERFPKERDPIIRVAMVQAIGGFDVASARAVVRRATKDSEADVRVVACQMLGKTPGSDGASVLAEILGSDTDQDVRLAAAEALGKTRDPKAIAALGLALEDRDPAMQYRAVTSLRKIAPKDLGNDAEKWRQYVKSETPGETPGSVADRGEKKY
jgi:HEAT repeat protein